MTDYIKTKDMSLEEWRSKRKDSIGASEAGAVMGLNPYRSIVDVWLEKTGQSEPVEDNLAMRLGRELEPVIIKLAEEREGFKIRQDNKIRIDPELPFLTTNLDGMVVGEKVPVELKTAAIYDGEIPDTYFAQIQAQMMITGAPSMYYVVLVLGIQKELIVDKFNRNDEFIADMRKELSDFWNINVLQEIPPEPKTADEAKKLYSQSNTGSVVEADLIIQQQLKELVFERQRIRDSQDIVDGLKTSIMNFMKDSEQLEYDGDFLVTWRKDRDSEKFDKDAFIAKHPKLYRKFLVSKEGSRRFLIK